MVLLIRGNSLIGKRGNLLKIENGLLWIEGIGRALKPSQVEVGEEELELIKKDKDIMDKFYVDVKFRGRYLLKNKLTKM